MKNNKRISIKAIKVSQPLADFYIAKMTARDLLSISFVEPLEYKDENGKLKGSQRKQDETRLKEIGRYINSVEMTFPNSIILAANYTTEGKVLDESSKDKWEIKPINESDDNFVEITLPLDKELAAIIDGQHRLMSFRYAKEECLDIELVCSIFFDLPNSYQAYLFATVNGNQKKVDRSLALEQFGFNVQDEPEISWTPEKLAVFLSRKLNFTKGSPLYGRIKLAPLYKNKDIIFSDIKWYISTSVIVDCVLSLISSNSKRDRVEMSQKHIFKQRSRQQLKDIRDNSPLRQYYLECSDDFIYDIIFNFFKSVNNLLWTTQESGSILLKTIGIQGLSDLLRKIVSETSDVENIDFDKYLKPAETINWSDNYFSLGGVGRTRVKRVLFKINNYELGNISKEDIRNINRIINKL